MKKIKIIEENQFFFDFYFIFFLTVSSVNTSMGMYVFSVNEACFTV